MTRLSYNQQADLLCKIMQRDIERIKSLPADEAKKEARETLMVAGIVDENGELTEPYAALGKAYVQYFWETDPIRAMEWAEQAAKRPSSSVKNPAVIGAVIDLGNCLDLTNRKSQPFLRLGYEKLQEYCLKNGVEMPQNDNVGNNKDELLRRLDCAVIQMIHATIQLEQNSGIMPFDSVRECLLKGDRRTRAQESWKKHTRNCAS